MSIFLIFMATIIIKLEFLGIVATDKETDESTVMRFDKF